MLSVTRAHALTSMPPCLQNHSYSVLPIMPPSTYLEEMLSLAGVLSLPGRTSPFPRKQGLFASCLSEKAACSTPSLANSRPASPCCPSLSPGPFCCLGLSHNLGNQIIWGSMLHSYFPSIFILSKHLPKNQSPLSKKVSRMEIMKKGSL